MTLQQKMFAGLSNMGFFDLLIKNNINVTCLDSTEELLTSTNNLSQTGLALWMGTLLGNGNHSLVEIFNLLPDARFAAVEKFSCDDVSRRYVFKDDPSHVFVFLLIPPKAIIFGYVVQSSIEIVDHLCSGTLTQQHLEAVDDRKKLEFIFTLESKQSNTIALVKNDNQKFELEQYGISKQDYIDALNRAARWTENDFNQGMQNVHPQITKDWAMIELYESIVGYKATYIIDKSGNYPQLVKRTIYMA